MEVTHKKLVEHTRDELMQFPELARKYLVNLFILLLELRRSPKYMENACSVVEKFKSQKQFVKEIEKGQMENFDSLFLSATNMLLMASTFTDEEAKELYDMLCALDKNSLRNYFASNGIIVSGFFGLCTYSRAWEILNIRTRVLTSTEAFRIERQKPNLLKFLEEKKQPGEILSSFVISDEIGFHSFKKPNESRWRYLINIFPSPLSVAEHLVSVLEQ
jgi:hypothetical protein